jgi:hypothetical protein
LHRDALEDLVRLDFSPSNRIDAVDVEEELYLARSIIAREQTFSRTNFVRFSALSQVLSKYDALHEGNVVFFGQQCGAFYKDVLQSVPKTEVFLKDFQNQLAITMSWRVGDELAEKGSQR